jgi:hypothetical protein
MDGDARSFRVALVASELVNPQRGGLDALAVLKEEHWGVVQLPDADYPAEVAEPLLEQVAEQTEEFSRHGYRLAILGRRVGLADALQSRGIPPLRQLDPSTVDELRAFLADGGE